MEQKRKTNIKVKLTEEDGNAFIITDRVIAELRKAGYNQEFVKQYLDEATSADYNNLLIVTSQYVEII